MFRIYLFRFSFFFFNDTATTEIYTLSLHDALPIWPTLHGNGLKMPWCRGASWPDRKSTRLNSSHVEISYAVFCLKKKNNQTIHALFLIEKSIALCVLEN